MDDRACCACLTIVYDPEDVGDGSNRERWRCTSCGAYYYLRSDRAELAALREENERLKAWNERITKVMRGWAESIGKPMPNSHAVDCVVVISTALRARLAEAEAVHEKAAYACDAAVGVESLRGQVKRAIQEYYAKYPKEE